jgi:hypothetical protein
LNLRETDGCESSIFNEVIYPDLVKREPKGAAKGVSCKAAKGAKEILNTWFL